MDFRPEGLIAVDKIGGVVLFLDPDDFTVLDRLADFPPRPHELALSPDRREAYVPIYGSGIYGSNPDPGHLIAIIDLATRRHAGDIDITPYRGPHTLRFGASGHLYVCADASGVVLVIDAAKREIVDVLDARSTGCHRLALTPDGSKLYTENEDDVPWCSVIDLKRRSFALRLPTPNGAAGIDISPDGRTLVVTDGKTPELIVVDALADAQIGRVRLEGQDEPAQIVRFSPDGRTLVVTNLACSVATLFADGLFGAQRVVPTGQSPMDMAFHPNGALVVIGNQGDGTLSVIDLGSGREIARPSAGEGVETLAYF